MENGSNESRTEKFNQAIRGVVVLSLTFGLIYGFIITKVVSTETFVVIASVVFTWWFKSRDEKQLADTALAKVATPPTPTPEGRP